jgi:hypothetical protein
MANGQTPKDPGFGGFTTIFDPFGTSQGSQGSQILNRRRKYPEPEERDHMDPLPGSPGGPQEVPRRSQEVLQEVQIQVSL